MRTNLAVKHPAEHTHEGAQAARITSEQELRRTVAACLLWEDGFYESGESIADRIKALVPKCRTSFVAACAFEARTKMKLRHVPLLLAREMARHDGHRALVGKLLPSIIQRADELAEFLAIYWKDKRQPLSKQVKIGLAAAFGQFNEYALAKYNRYGAVKLRDVLFLSHAKPADGKKARIVQRKYKNGTSKGLARHDDSLFTKIVNRTLATPDTWEVNLSAGADKKVTFERLMLEKNLGGLAFLRNLRNMRDAGVDRSIVEQYAQVANFSRVLPFRFIAAARAVPAWEDILEPLMLSAVANQTKMAGRTVLAVDVSGSMSSMVSSKSDMTRLDAAAALAILLREVCEGFEIFAFNTGIKPVAPRRGFALRDAIGHAQGGTDIGLAVRHANTLGADRLIVLTDEQSHTAVGNPSAQMAYMVNVATAKNGVGYGNGWQHIDGWSESIIDYVIEIETQQEETR